MATHSHWGALITRFVIRFTGYLWRMVYWRARGECLYVIDDHKGQGPFKDLP